MHKRPVCRRRFLCQAHVRKLDSFLYIKDVVLSKDIYIRILSDSCCLTVVPASIHQTPGFKPGFRCQATVRLLYRLLCIKESTILHLSSSKKLTYSLNNVRYL